MNIIYLKIWFHFHHFFTSKYEIGTLYKSKIAYLIFQTTMQETWMWHFLLIQICTLLQNVWTSCFKLQCKKLECDIFYWYRLVPSCIIILKIAVIEKHIIEENGKCCLKCQQKKTQKKIDIIILNTFMSLALGTKCCKSFIDAIKNGILSSRTCRR